MRNHGSKTKNQQPKPISTDCGIHFFVRIRFYQNKRNENIRWAPGRGEKRHCVRNLSGIISKMYSARSLLLQRSPDKREAKMSSDDLVIRFCYPQGTSWSIPEPFRVFQCVYLLLTEIVICCFSRTAQSAVNQHELRPRFSVGRTPLIRSKFVSRVRLGM